MVKTSNQGKSSFIVSLRLKPSQSFSGLQAQITTADGYRLSFQDDMVWIEFDSTPDEWQRRHDIGTQALRTVLAILAMQTAYAFTLEPIQWIEDKPRAKTGNANYVLGRLGPDLTVQEKPPTVSKKELKQVEIYAHLARRNPYYRYALLDYSIALSFPQESIVFCARSVESIEKYFNTVKRSLPKQNLHARTLMTEKLCLPKKYTTEFFKIANNTVIARHVGDPNKIRSPKIEEIRFCIVFNRVVLDRVSLYLWHLLSNDLPKRWKYPEDEKPPNELLETNKSSTTKMLKQILSSEIS